MIDAAMIAFCCLALPTAKVSVSHGKEFIFTEFAYTRNSFGLLNTPHLLPTLAMPFQPFGGFVPVNRRNSSPL
jgi:hypothetical protein